MTDRNTDIAQAAHDAYPHETWIFIDGEYTDTGFYDYTDDAWQPCEKWLGSITHWMPEPAPPEHIADVSKKISGSSEFPNNQKGGEQ